MTKHLAMATGSLSHWSRSWSSSLWTGNTVTVATPATTTLCMSPGANQRKPEVFLSFQQFPWFSLQSLNPNAHFNISWCFSDVLEFLPLTMKADKKEGGEQTNDMQWKSLLPSTRMTRLTLNQRLTSWWSWLFLYIRSGLCYGVRLWLHRSGVKMGETVCSYLTCWIVPKHEGTQSHSKQSTPCCAVEQRRSAKQTHPSTGNRERWHGGDVTSTLTVLDKISCYDNGHIKLYLLHLLNS